MSYPFVVNPMNATDAYKLGHIFQYDPRTHTVNSNWTPRKSRIKGVNYVQFLGLNAMIKKYFLEDFQTRFFSRPVEEVVHEYLGRVNTFLETKITVDHIRDLHELGYIPLRIRAIKEGMSTPVGVAQMVVENTGGSKFMWVTNYFETLFSCELWQPSTCGTIIREYYEVGLKYAMETNSVAKDFVRWQFHNFSMRGMPGVTAAMTADLGHLTYSYGSDTFPTPDFIKHYYSTDYAKELVSGSVAATEHSVMCVGTGIFIATQEQGSTAEKKWERYGDFEFQVFKRLITEVYPTGVLSIVSDTWDLWKVLTEYLPKLKDEILARNGKIVIRPDSGGPANILCGLKPIGGTPYSEPIYADDEVVNKNTLKGVVELLWDVFGGTISNEGYKVLDPHIGAIYGDAITLDRAKDIFKRLKEKKFASTNVVLGIGSYTYQMITRDTFGSN